MAQVTRLWPWGVPGHLYGSFAGKTPVEPPEEIDVQLDLEITQTLDFTEEL